MGGLIGQGRTGSSALSKERDNYVLVPPPRGLFDLTVLFQDGMVRVHIHQLPIKGTRLRDYMNELDGSSQTGVYLHGDGSRELQSLVFRQLHMGPTIDNSLPTLTVAPTVAPMNSPAWTGYTQSPTITPPQLAHLAFVNTYVNMDLTVMDNQSIVDTDNMPHVTIRAETASPTVDSVVFCVNSSHHDAENRVPFCIGTGMEDTHHGMYQQKSTSFPPCHGVMMRMWQWKLRETQ